MEHSHVQINMSLIVDIIHGPSNQQTEEMAQLLGFQGQQILEVI